MPAHPSKNLLEHSTSMDGVEESHMHYDFKPCINTIATEFKVSGLSQTDP
jgi:hypothetical protein